MNLRIVGMCVMVMAGAACAAPVDAEPVETTGVAQQAITNADDDDDDPAVVALLIGGKIFCTGVLITPNVVATAGHCVSPTPPDQVYFGAKPSKTSKKGTMIAVADSKVHPDFDEDTLANDIALIGLAQKAPVAPLTVVTKDLEASDVGRPIRLVGFGATGFAEDNDLRKRSGKTTILSYGDDDFRFHPGPSQTCNGDSGGPALAMVGDHEAVIGLASSGDQNCKTYGRDMRIDRYVPFIKSYAKAYAASASPADESKGCGVAPSSRSSSGTAGLALLALAAAGLVKRRRARSA